MKLLPARNMIFRKPIFLVYLTLFFLLTVSAWVMISVSRDVVSRYETAISTISVKLQLLLDIRRNADRVKSAVVGYVVHSEKEVEWKEEKSVFEISQINSRNWDEYGKMVTGRQEKILYDSVRLLENLQAANWDRVIKDKKNNTIATDTGFHQALLNTEYKTYEYYVSLLSDLAVKRVDADNKQIANTVVVAEKRILLFVSVSFLLLITLGMLIVRAIKKLQKDNRLLLEQEKQLKEQKLLFEGILISAPDGIIGFNQSGNIDLFNKHAQELFGYEINEIAELTIEKIISFEKPGTRPGNITELLAKVTGDRISKDGMDLYGLRKNKDIFPVDISFSQIETNIGLYYIMDVRDVTNRKMAEAELQEKNDVLKSLSTYLQNVREEERKYLAREVHDELGQLASAIKIDIDWLGIRYKGTDEPFNGRIIHANKTLEILITTIRKIASSLRPSVIDDFGLNEALKWLCSEFQSLNEIPCHFEAGFNDTNLLSNVKIELFRMVQESITNVMRHAKANSLKISTWEDEFYLHLTIIDNGVGFSMEQRKKTFGLIGLEERAQSIGGKLIIDSSPGNGTIIKISILKSRSFV